MKYKVISLAVVALMIIGAFIVQGIEHKGNRYHQHLEAIPKAPCTNCGPDVFCTHLPLMSIKTDAPMPEPFAQDVNGYPIQNDEMVSGTVAYFDSETNQNHLTDTPSVSEKALVRVRGASSRYFDKKGYLLKFKEENLADNKDVSLSGMVSDSDWVLHGPFLDKTLIRNYLCYNLAGEIMDYAPNVRFCELFLNDHYMGLYLIVEKIGYNENGRINLSKTDPDLMETSYIILADRGAKYPSQRLTTFGAYSYMTVGEGNLEGQLELVYPSKTMTPRQHDFIEDDISRFERALFSFDYKDPKRGYRSYIDEQSFVDYFLITEFTLNYDAVGLSTYLYKDVRGKLEFCVWDFNSAFDNYINSFTDPQSFESHKKMWYKQLFKDKRFVKQVVHRYSQLRKTYFSEAYLENYIDETVQYLGPAIERNNEMWGYAFHSSYSGHYYDFLEPAERNPRSYDQAIAQLKGCIKERARFMDDNIDHLYTLCHESVNKKYNHYVGRIN